MALRRLSSRAACFAGLGCWTRQAAVIPKLFCSSRSGGQERFGDQPAGASEEELVGLPKEPGYFRLWRLREAKRSASLLKEIKSIDQRLILVTKQQGHVIATMSSTVERLARSRFIDDVQGVLREPCNAATSVFCTSVTLQNIQHVLHTYAPDFVDASPAALLADLHEKDAFFTSFEAVVGSAVQSATRQLELQRGKDFNVEQVPKATVKLEKAADWLRCEAEGRQLTADLRQAGERFYNLVDLLLPGYLQRTLQRYNYVLGRNFDAIVADAGPGIRVVTHICGQRLGMAGVSELEINIRGGLVGASSRVLTMGEVKHNADVAELDAAKKQLALRLHTVCYILTKYGVREPALLGVVCAPSIKESVDVDEDETLGIRVCTTLHNF
eukprot:jgi/Chlat1/6109/Chrsp402S05651